MYFLAKLMFGLMLASVSLATNLMDLDHGYGPDPPGLVVDAKNKDPTKVHLKFNTKQKDGSVLMVWLDNPECSIRMHNLDHMNPETITVPVKCSEKELIINMEDLGYPKTLPAGRYNAWVVVLKKKGGDMLSKSKRAGFTLGAEFAVEADSAEADSASVTAKPGMLTLVVVVVTIVFLSL
eukprot:280271_1